MTLTKFGIWEFQSCLTPTFEKKDGKKIKKFEATAEKLQMVQLAYYASADRGHGQRKGRSFAFDNREESDVCWKCHQEGHWAKDCTATTPEEWDGI